MPKNEYSRPANLDDLRKIIQSLNEKNAEYILIGGYPMPSCTWRRKVMLIDLLMVRQSLSKPILWVPILYLKLFDSIGRSVANHRLIMVKNHLFFTMFPLMKYLVRWGKMGYSLKRLSTNQAHLISASKASSDYLVRVWHHTYGLPIVMANCSNNYLITHEAQP